MIAARYLHYSTLKPIAASFALLALLFLFFATADLLNDAVSRLLSAATLPKLLLVQTLIACEVLIPSALYFGVVDGLGRMYRNSELVVLYASGWSELRTALKISQILIPAAVLVALLSVVVRPMAYEISYALEAESAERLEPDNLVPGRFYPLADAEMTLSLGGVDGEVMLDVFVQGEGEDGSRVIRARQGRLLEGETEATGVRVIELQDGYAYRLGDGTDHEYTFERLQLRLEAPQGASRVRNRRAQPTQALFGSENPKEMAELQWRLSLPFTTLLLGLLAVPLARSAPRQGRFRQMLFAILAYAVVFNLAIIAKGWVENGLVMAFPGLWWVHGLLLLTLVLLLRRPAFG